MNNAGVYLVKRADVEVSHHHPFYKCVTYTSEGVETKFDFTDETHCSECIPKLLSPDLHHHDELTKDITLKAFDDKSILAYEHLILHPPTENEVLCHFYIDKLSLQS